MAMSSLEFFLTKEHSNMLIKFRNIHGLMYLRFKTEQNQQNKIKSPASV